MSTHMKTGVSKWLSEEEMKKGIELKVEEEKEEKEKKKNEMERIVKKETNEEQNKVKKDNDNANEIDEQTREKGLNENYTYVINIFIYLLYCIKHEKNKRLMKWWNEREQKGKTEIIEKLKTMSNEQFGVWLLNDCK
ncbi:hypothetical protein RFI_01452 [Reticulomyxa filosa]|uniref:Uncharacterized protein n=1 Tax=Reticulomyxa filosa TaxID=46433 RepID=X6PAP4_RETFI|nr:hypothetical protein RFI_01452 [Reticulomyxa filosa]|eukprot:ETO35610.1 hypothetical protein RFI_01452 [Reticulomyxa filosa]